MIVCQFQKKCIAGITFSKKKPQGKLLTVIDGEIFDVAVDLRKNSKTYGKYFHCVKTINLIYLYIYCQIFFLSMDFCAYLKHVKFITSAQIIEMLHE